MTSFLRFLLKPPILLMTKAFSKMSRYRPIVLTSSLTCVAISLSEPAAYLDGDHMRKSRMTLGSFTGVEREDL
jgi:hypothetical protein